MTSAEITSLVKEMEEAEKKKQEEIYKLAVRYDRNFEQAKSKIANCESEKEAQEILVNLQNTNDEIMKEMKEITRKSEEKVCKITKEVEDLKRKERDAKERRQRVKNEEEERRQREKARKEEEELENLRRQQEEENRRKVEEMKERMRNDEEFVRKYIVNLRIEGFGAGVAVYDGDKIVGAAADASLGPVANARVGMVATLTDTNKEKSIDYNLAKVGLFDDTVKARAGVKVGVSDEGPAAGSAYVKLASLDIGDGAVGFDAGVKATGGFEDKTGRKGLIAEYNFANANVGPVQASAGLAATTAFKADNKGISAELLGTGFSVGDDGFKIKIFGSSIGFGW